jgi:hypothetical protein
MKKVPAAALVFAIGACPAQAALVVSKAQTSNVTCASGVCTATAADAVLNVKDLKRLLNAGDLTVASGSTAMDIDFDTNLQWTKPHSLTLDAFRGITIGVEITSEGPGGITLATNNGGSGGDLVFTAAGSISFWSTANTLVINGNFYTLVDSIATLAADIAAGPSSFYALSKSYNASSDGAYPSDPVPTPFAGTFEGLGHTIDKLTLETVHVAQSGFFANVASGGAVRDLAFTNASFIGNKVLVGMVAALNQGTVSGVSAGVSIQAPGGSQGGGLVYTNAGTIVRCAVSGNIVATGSDSGMGGLVGINQGTILQSRSSAAVQAHAVGGLVYENDAGGTISLSSAAGAVQTDGLGDGNSEAGGFIALNGGTIDQSFSTGAVNAGAGGHGGHHGHHPVFAFGGGFASENTGTISNSYSIGGVTGGTKSLAGGFTNNAQGVIATSYSTGAVAKNRKTGPGFAQELSDGANDYWDTDTSGTTVGCTGDCVGVTGLTTAQLQSALPAGFDPQFWTESAGINNGLPYLIANPPQ